MEMFSEFVTWDLLTSFVGMVAVVGIFVQFTKSLLKGIHIPDWGIRVYALAIAVALNLVIMYSEAMFGAETIVLAIVNSVVVTLAALGAYEVLSDPKDLR